VTASPTFSTLQLHPSLLQGLKELGFARPTPIQGESIPPALEGRDLLACAMTGSGKTYAFLLPILHHLMSKPRGKTRALVLTPTRELAAQIHDSLKDVTIHTPLTGAAVFGGVGMGPQEHAFRSGADVIIATPGRLLDHFRQPYAKLEALEYLVLDEADRMLDMGFLQENSAHLPSTKRQTLFFSATMPPPIAALAQEMLNKPVTLNLQRTAAPAKGITQAVYPVAQDLKSALLVTLLKRGDMPQALVFTRTKHRANRLASQLVAAGIKAERIHGNRSQSQRTQALAGFKDGAYQVLVATDIAARGIDVEALGHVVNFDVPVAAEDYIHRVGRTARAEATGEAFTFVSPEEEGELKLIERAIKKQLPRVTVPDFDYSAKPQAKLEVPIAERIAEIRKKKAEDRARAAAKVARRSAAQQAEADRKTSKPARPAARSSSGPASRGPDRPAEGAKVSGGARRGPRRPGSGGGNSGGSGGAGSSGRSGGSGGSARRSDSPYK
jgi:ATP-dependent RNA helicase RhlE